MCERETNDVVKLKSAVKSSATLLEVFFFVEKH